MDGKREKRKEKLKERTKNRKAGRSMETSICFPNVSRAVFSG